MKKELITLPAVGRQFTGLQKSSPGAGLLPDTPIEFAGIYRCVNCGSEAVIRKFECLPREQRCSEHGSAEPFAIDTEVSWVLATAVREQKCQHDNKHKKFHSIPELGVAN
jgi:hypothetical protein